MKIFAGIFLLSNAASLASAFGVPKLLSKSNGSSKLKAEVDSFEDTGYMLETLNGPNDQITLDSELGSIDEGLIPERKTKKSNKPTVWSEFSALSAETGAINLGQGFPNWDPPQFVIDEAIKAIKSGFNQYTRTAGHPRLVEHLAERYSHHFKRRVDPYSQIAITIGASQALYVAIKTLLNPGDEVILLEPYFDLYVGQIEIADATPVYSPMKVKDNEWVIDFDSIRSAITSSTRLIIINSPHNPTGKVFTRDEMEEMACIVRENPRLMVISDEVYKYMVYQNDEAEKTIEPASHIHFATLPGMWDRTITISSAGKTFSITGWQVGWVLGPQWFIQEVQNALPYMQFCAPTPFQEAMAAILERADLPYKGFVNYYEWLRNDYLKRREKLEIALNAVNIPTMKGQGGFFLIGDVSHFPVPDSYLKQETPAMPNMTHDWAFCRYLAMEHGLIGIPTSAFFRPNGTSNNSAYGKLVRFCFCKNDETLHAAASALEKMKQSF
mmetsp:Transcript_7605/g.11400  ORF Transcript_7605/g.11400 Transcript_7605/m.11400 type:complete len:498 (+) Transcript_7605:41-1534(+)